MNDQSKRITKRMGAEVVKHEAGYGNAYKEGLRHVSGDYVIMADSDNTYDLSEIPLFIEKVSEGYEFVIGNRFKGGMDTGSMPWLHRHIGNPLLSCLLNTFHRTGIRDARSGFRAISGDALRKLDLKTLGMEFASEMIIEAKRKGLRMGEVPICYRKRLGKTKMKSFRDGWRHMKLIISESAVGQDEK